MSFDEEQLDALREVVNIAMGRAGDSLARLFGRFVELPVPAVRCVEASHVIEALGALAPVKEPVTVVRQAFSAAAAGECLVVFEAVSFPELALLSEQSGGDVSSDPEELILHLANLLVGACVSGIADQLSLDMYYSAPSIMARAVPLDTILDPDALPWKTALVVDVNFRLEGHAFVAHTLVFWPELAMAVMRDHIDSFLAGL